MKLSMLVNNDVSTHPFLTYTNNYIEVQPNSLRGEYTINLKLEDPCTSVDNFFKINIINNPPLFSGSLNSETFIAAVPKTIDFPSYSDPDGHEVTVKVFLNMGDPLPTYI